MTVLIVSLSKVLTSHSIFIAFFLILYDFFTGDQISRRGPMTGGFSDAKKSKLGLARTLKTLNSDLESANVLKSFKNYLIIFIRLNWIK